jgi:hypothetical protein
MANINFLWMQLMKVTHNQRMYMNFFIDMITHTMFSI